MIELFDRRWGECRLCKLLNNEHYAPAGYLARFCVNLATFIWSVVVLIRDDALGPRIYLYRQMLAVMPEDAWAWLGIATVSIGMFRLVHRDRPRWWGAIGYWLLMVFWVFLDAAVIMSDQTITPAALGAISVVAFLSIYASASHSRVRRHEPE